MRDLDPVTLIVISGCVAAVLIVTFLFGGRIKAIFQGITLEAGGAENDVIIEDVTAGRDVKTDVKGPKIKIKRVKGGRDTEVKVNKD